MSKIISNQSNSNSQDQTLFENLKHLDENQVEFWYARELQTVLGYKRWEDFYKLVERTKNLDFEMKSDHIRLVPKKVILGSMAEREIDDFELSREFCYKVAMQGRTKQCILARTYFASQTRKQELMEEFLEGQTPNLDYANSPSLKGWQSQTDGVVLKNNQFPYNPKLKEKAKQLRKAGSLSEVILWNNLKNKQLLGLDFDRQKIIGNYIVDFFARNMMTVIEIDGESHDYKGEYDVIRENYLKSLGLEILHFQDIEVKKATGQVLESLYSFFENKKKLLMVT